MGKIVYESPWKSMKIEEDYFKVRGKTMKNFRIVKPDSVVILPFLDKNTIIMEKQFRFALNRKIYELPAGSIEPGENKIKAVQRELSEETGYFPKKVRFLFSSWSNPAIMTNTEYFYVASDLVGTKNDPDESEIIQPLNIRFNDALEMAYSGRIMDTKTIVALLFYKTHSKGNIKGG